MERKRGRDRRREGKMIRIKRKKTVRGGRGKSEVGQKKEREKKEREKETQTKPKNFIILTHECAVCCLMLQYNEDLYDFY